MRLSDYQRRGHQEPREIPAAEQARYEAAVAGLKAVEAYEHTWYGYEYDVEIEPPPATHWVWDETEAEHAERIKDFPKTITIPVMRPADTSAFFKPHN